MVPGAVSYLKGNNWFLTGIFKHSTGTWDFDRDEYDDEYVPFSKAFSLPL